MSPVQGMVKAPSRIERADNKASPRLESFRTAADIHPVNPHERGSVDSFAHKTLVACWFGGQTQLIALCFSAGKP